MVARGKTTLSHTPVLGNAYITSVTCGIKIQSLFILARRAYVIPSDSKYFVFINLSKPLFRQNYLSPHACSPQEQKMYG